MALFDKIKIVGNTIGKTTESLKNNFANNVAEGSILINEKNKISELEKEKKSLDNEIENGYVQIGKKYVEYVMTTNEMPGIDVNDILKMLDPKMSRKIEIKNEIVELEKKIKDQEILRVKQKIEKECEKEKEKLDKALSMDIISQEEYNGKLKKIMSKVIYFEEIRKIEAQFNMNIITLEEKEDKINELLNS